MIKLGVEQVEQSKFANVVNSLRSGGLSEDEIAEVVAQVTKEAAEAFFSEALFVLDEEDLKALDRISSPEHAEGEIKARYFKKTGKSAELQMSEFYEKFSEEFLREYNE